MEGKSKEKKLIEAKTNEKSMSREIAFPERIKVRPI